MFLCSKQTLLPKNFGAENSCHGHVSIYNALTNIQDYTHLMQNFGAIYLEIFYF